MLRLPGVMTSATPVLDPRLDSIGFKIPSQGPTFKVPLHLVSAGFSISMGVARASVCKVVDLVPGHEEGSEERTNMSQSPILSLEGWRARCVASCVLSQNIMSY